MKEVTIIDCLLNDMEWLQEAKPNLHPDICDFLDIVLSTQQYPLNQEIISLPGRIRIGNIYMGYNGTDMSFLACEANVPEDVKAIFEEDDEPAPEPEPLLG